MIEQLTQEQIDKLEVYKDRWIKVGLDTGKINKKECKKWIKEAYKNAKLVPPDKFVWTRSPMEAIKEAENLSVDKTRKTDFDSYFCYGSHEASWLSFYSYCMEVLNLECCNILKPHMEIAKHCGWWIPFDSCVVVSAKPIEINMKNGVLHCDGGPAIKYADGFCVWALNGVRVSQEIAETPWNKLDVQLIAKEKNAEVRREIVRKIGMERIISGLGAKVVDTVGDYELLSFDIGDGRIRPYLKMTNPSIGVYHIEGVAPDVKTVKEALKFRNGTEEEPVTLT